MRSKTRQKIYHVTLEFAGGVFRTVKAKGKDREVAEHRALKHHPNAVRVKRDAV